MLTGKGLWTFLALEASKLNFLIAVHPLDSIKTFLFTISLKRTGIFIHISSLFKLYKSSKQVRNFLCNYGKSCLLNSILPKKQYNTTIWHVFSFFLNSFLLYFSITIYHPYASSPNNPHTLVLAHVFSIIGILHPCCHTCWLRISKFHCLNIRQLMFKVYF